MIPTLAVIFILFLITVSTTVAFWELWENGGCTLFSLTAPFAVLVLLYMWVILI